jgi:hypothetical protein
MVLALGGAAMAQQGTPPDGKGGGNKPPVEASNNLAYPSVVAGGGAAAYFTIDFNQALLGVNFSYGCPDPAIDAEYPNKSCANDLGTVFYDKTDPVCTALCGDSAERMFWQKVSGNVWSAQTLAPVAGTNDVASFVDWGDALESRTSSATSVVRVETMPFYDSVTGAFTGYEMWHAYGLGKTEMWGIRVDDGNLAYSADVSTAIVRTTNAKLQLAKLGAGPADGGCPTVGAPGGSSPYASSISVWTGTGWQGAAFNAAPIAYSPELSISGKYVYGYNWNLKSFSVTEGTEKAGWWRLTFFTPASEVIFTPDTKIGAPWDYVATVGAAELTTKGDKPLALNLHAIPLAEEEESSLPLYVAKVSPQTGGYNLTYIDVCIAVNKGGGSKGRQ